jgi:hypothetical protein
MRELLLAALTVLICLAPNVISAPTTPSPLHNSYNEDSYTYTPNNADLIPLRATVSEDGEHFHY